MILAACLVDRSCCLTLAKVDQDSLAVRIEPSFSSLMKDCVYANRWSAPRMCRHWPRVRLQRRQFNHSLMSIPDLMESNEPTGSPYSPERFPILPVSMQRVFASMRLAAVS